MKKIRSTSTYMSFVTSNYKFFRYATPGPQQNFLYAFRCTHFGLFSYYVSVTNLRYIWVYLDPFIPKSVESGEQIQTALRVLFAYILNTLRALFQINYAQKYRISQVSCCTVVIRIKYYRSVIGGRSPTGQQERTPQRRSSGRRTTEGIATKLKLLPR